MKKDRKKDVKRAEDKYQRLEDKLVELKRSQRRPYPYDSRYDSPGMKMSSLYIVLDFISFLGFSLPPPNTTGSSIRQSVRHTSPNSTSTVDDSYLAKMIFDDPSQQFSPLITNQKASLHKSTSALHDVTEMPRPPSPPTAHRQLSGSRSVAYHGLSLYYPPSDRSHHSSYMSDLNDSFIGTDQQQRSPRTSVTSSGSGRYDPDALRAGNLADDMIHHYSRNKQSSPIHGRLSLDNRSPGGPYYNQHQLRSSPESMNSPSHRSSYRSSAGLFSPEPPHLTTGARSRPQSSHSSGTPPPQGVDYHSQRGGGIRNNREMDLQEALLMDQDEGTLV